MLSGWLKSKETKSAFCVVHIWHCKKLLRCTVTVSSKSHKHGGSKIIFVLDDKFDLLQRTNTKQTEEFVGLRETLEEWREQRLNASIAINGALSSWGDNWQGIGEQFNKNYINV